MSLACTACYCPIRDHEEMVVTETDGETWCWHAECWADVSGDEPRLTTDDEVHELLSALRHPCSQPRTEEGDR